MFNVTVDDKSVKLFIDFANKRIVNAVRQGINMAGIETASYVKSRHLTGGTTDDRLGVRSGLLRKSAHGLKAVIEGNRVVGGSGFGDGLIYAPVQISNGGKKTVITPNKPGGSLAVPFRGYGSRTGPIGYGRTKQPGPLDYPKGFLEPFKTKKGNMMLVHKTWSSGTKGRTGGAKGAAGKFAYGGKCTITPYYMLYKSVTVPARVFPERVMMVRRRYITETIKNAMFNMMSKRNAGG